MKLVIIYGPPAVGKLTVAKELAKLTDYKILHNHLVIDLIESIFSRDNKKFWELIDTYRLDLLDMAAKEKTNGVILTSVNIKGQDEPFIRNLVETVGRHGGTSHFVHLNCDMGELKGRLVSPSRKEHKKLTDVKLFDEFVTKNRVGEQIEFVDSLKIDNTNIPPEKAAMMIKEHYKL